MILHARKRGVAEAHLAVGHVLVDAGLGADAHAVADVHVVGDADLTCDEAVGADLRCAGDAHLSR